jgi:hypothetical protein
MALLIADEAVVLRNGDEAVAAVEGEEIALLISIEAVLSITEEEVVPAEEGGFDRNGSGVLINLPSESTAGTTPVATVVGSVFVAGTGIPVPGSSLVAVP